MAKEVQHANAAAKGNALGWSAAGAAGAALMAWAACCVVPMALSIAGVSFAGTALLAGQRTWLTAGAAVVVAIGWWSHWRRRRACAVNASCPRPSRGSTILLIVASVMVLLALAWQPFIEPRALLFLRGFRG